MGQLGVAYVIRNSCKYWGRSVTDEVFKKSRYSCWLPGSPTLYNLDQATEVMTATATRAMLAAWFYLEADPTDGAVYYLNPKEVIAATGKLPDWWQIDADSAHEIVIGHHAFRRPKIVQKV